MSSIRLSLVAIACGAACTNAAFAEDAGVVRITDRRAPATQRSTIEPVAFDHHEGAAELHDDHAHDSHDHSHDGGHVHGGHMHGGIGCATGMCSGGICGNGMCGGCGNLGIVAGHQVIGDYGCQMGHGWCGHGGCGSCCPSFCDRLRFTHNPILDAPLVTTCEFVGCILSKFRRCRCCRAAGGRGMSGPSGTAVHPVDPNYFDRRDGRAYSAHGYGVPMAVPVAPTVHHTYNYGWGIPSSRITPISRPVAGY